MIKVGIIGGGACGILSAIELKRKLNDKVEIDIIEKNNRLGKKILASGNGRCNITNLSANPLKYNNVDFVVPTLKNFLPEAFVKWLASIGVVTYFDEENRVYPISESANSCLDMMLLQLSNYKVNVVLDTVIDKITYRYKKYTVCGENFERKYDAIIVCIGSNAGDKYKKNPLFNSLTELGYKTTKMSPSLSPIVVKDDIKSLKGIKVRANAKICINGHETLTSGEILFKEDSLSGIAIFELSSYLARHKVASNEFNECFVEIDLMPYVKQQELLSDIVNIKLALKNSPIDYLLRGMFNKMLALKLYQRCKIKIGSRKCSDLTQDELKRLVNEIKHFRCSVNTSKNSDIYQVVSGGIDLSMVEKRTLESKKHPFMYFGGEVLDVDGICGGYNLHFAFASGYTIAKDIISKVK